MSQLWTMVPGVILIAGALREVFKELFAPTESGMLSQFIARGIFGALRSNRKLNRLAGPLALVTIIACWTLLLIVGFALLYQSSIPQNFRVDSGRNERGFGSALYFSFEVMTTLGLGELTPKPEWLRMLVSFHALIGFALVTASISWVVLLYPAISRMRALAIHTSMLAEAEQRTGVTLVACCAESMLEALASQLIRTRIDLVYFPIIYYFHAQSERGSLAHALPVLSRMAKEGSGRKDEDRIRLAATELQVALEDVAKTLAGRFVKADGENTEETFRAYLEQHSAY